MTDDQLLRYSRHILLDEVGIEGQERVLAAHALIIGAGGLGSPAALYLASAGVGRITLVDDDVVDLSNLQRLIAHINGAHPDVPVILDAKRGDIGSTAEQYAVEAFDRFGADAVTLNPYMGRDSADPFLQRNERGCVFLCHTSNPGARDFQELDVGGQPLYQRIARTIANEWNADGNCALVVGATFPQ